MKVDLINGYTEGDTCNRNGCTGIIFLREVENCACHICPPCSACTEPREECPLCDWRAIDEEVQETPKMSASSYMYVEKPLDSMKIDWRASSHTHFSMIKKGVYPEGTTREDVAKEVRGTFGGRFESFGYGHFTYIAYTD